MGRATDGAAHAFAASRVGPLAALRPADEQVLISEAELASVASRVLREVLCSSSDGGPALQSHLRSRILGAGEPHHSRKCAFELSLLSLVDQGLLIRHGYGPWALYTVAEGTAAAAERLAYTEYQCLEQGGGLVVARPPADGARQAPLHLPCGAPHGTRRLTSPRSQGAARMRGVERPLSAGRQRVKRGSPWCETLPSSSSGDDLHLSLRKKLRMDAAAAAAPMQLSP